MAPDAQSWWLITVPRGYGPLGFHGTASEAERIRRHRAEWEGSVAQKFRVTDEQFAAWMKAKD